MSDLESCITAQRKAADEFKKAALGVNESVWNAPRVPGKWSPAQVADHVGLSTKIARDFMGEKPGMGSLPWFLRPVLSYFFLRPVLKKGFPKKGKGPSIFAPSPSPLPRDQLCARIDFEIAAMEADARGMVKSGKADFTHSFFGRMAVTDYVMFNARHFEHHREQLPTGQ